MSRLSQWYNIPNGQSKKLHEFARSRRRPSSAITLSITRNEANQARKDSKFHRQIVDSAIEVMRLNPHLMEVFVDRLSWRLVRINGEIVVKDPAGEVKP